MEPFYFFIIRIGAVFLLGIALLNVVGSIGLILTNAAPGGRLFALAAALNSTLWPFIAASALLRFDRWFALWAGSKAR